MTLINGDSKSIVIGFYDGLRPEEEMTLSEWSDKYRFLSPKASAEPGAWNTDRVPYMREIMDRLSPSDPCQRVYMMKGAQIAATEIAMNFVGYCIDLHPASVMYVMPTIGTLKKNSKTRIAPMISATPRLSKKVSPASSRNSGNTTFQKEFPGGVLSLACANSAADLRSMPVKYLILDEVDGYPLDLDGEGSPVDLAIARTKTYASKKIFMLSTPTIEGASVIEPAFQKTSQRYYYVPCPHCGSMQRLIWSNLKWEKGQPETAKYQCEHCDELIEERHKTEMLAHGEWRSLVPDLENGRVWGYHLSGMYSPLGWYSWSEMVSDWLDAQDDTAKLKVFVNTALGESWADKGDAPEWQNLYNRRETYDVNKPPVEVIILTAGVDVQKDRIEIEIVGWGRGRQSYSIDYRVLVGDTQQSEVWNELAKVIDEVWIREDGRELRLRKTAIDSGYNTQYVYDFVRNYQSQRVIAVRGQQTQAVPIAPPRPVDISIAGKKIGKTLLYNVGVSLLKSELYGWLRIEKIIDGQEEYAPDKYCHFPQYADEYFKGLTAEQLQLSINKKGFKQYTWVVKYQRNEPLDCRVYARAASIVINIDRYKDEHWDIVENELMNSTPKTSKKKKKKGNSGSSFWN